MNLDHAKDFLTRTIAENENAELTEALTTFLGNEGLLRNRLAEMQQEIGILRTVLSQQTVDVYMSKSS